MRSSCGKLRTGRFQTRRPASEANNCEAHTADDAARVAVLHWLDNIVIGLELCPFAAAARDATRVVVCASEAQALDCLRSEAARLEAQPPERPATTLVVLPHLRRSFDAFMGLRDELLSVLPRSLQAVPFHPRAEFYDMPGDAAEFVARSPEPVIHLLRVADVEGADAAWRGPEISAANEARLRGVGAGRLASLLAQCSRDT